MNEDNKHIDNPFFSVVIPVYNKAPHIAETIESVLNQSFKDFELIIIDDASTDSSMTVVEEFHDERMSLYQRDVPGPGGYAARNLGIKKAKAKWIAFLDADDIWFPEHLSKMHDVIIDNPSVFIAGAGWMFREEQQERMDPFYLEYQNEGSRFLDLMEYLENCLKKRQPIWTSVACINKESPKAKDLFPENRGIKRGGDVYAWLKMLCYHKGMAWSSHVGAIYNLDSTNMVTKTSAASPKIAGKNIYDELSVNINRVEIRLFTKYLNKILKHEWFIAIKLQKNYFNIRPLLYWRYDVITALKYTLISYLPKGFIKGILFRNE